MANLQLKALTTDNLIKVENYDFLQKNNPLLLKSLEGRIEGQNLDNLLHKRHKVNDIAMSEINLAIAGLNRDAKKLDIKLKELKLDQDPQLFEKQMEQLGLSIEGMTFDNIVKEVTANNAPLRAELAIALDTIQVERFVLACSANRLRRPRIRTLWRVLRATFSTSVWLCSKSRSRLRNSLLHSKLRSWRSIKLLVNSILLILSTMPPRLDWKHRRLRLLLRWLLTLTQVLPTPLLILNSQASSMATTRLSRASWREVDL